MIEIFGIKEVDSKGEKKNFWQRIGIAYKNSDGSINCYFDYFPSDSKIKIQIREKKENGNEKEDVNF